MLTSNLRFQIFASGRHIPLLLKFSKEHGKTKRTLENYISKNEWSIDSKSRIGITKKYSIKNTIKFIKVTLGLEYDNRCCSRIESGWDQ